MTSSLFLEPIGDTKTLHDIDTHMLGTTRKIKYFEDFGVAQLLESQPRMSSVRLCKERGMSSTPDIITQLQVLTQQSSYSSEVVLILGTD